MRGASGETGPIVKAVGFFDYGMCVHFGHFGDGPSGPFAGIWMGECWKARGIRARKPARKGKGRGIKDVIGNQ